MSVVRSWLSWVLPAVLSIGCSSEIDHGAVLGSDIEPASQPRDANDTRQNGRTTSTTTAHACDTGATWDAHRDFSLESAGSGSDFADAINELVRSSDASPVAVTSYMDAGCTWRVAFSASEGAGAPDTRHVATFTPMMRHPAGLWTAAPQSAGWLRIVDRAAHAVWIPMTDITGSATYGEASCASLSAVRGAATVSPSAADLRLTTTAGERTVRELLGEGPANGWSVRFTFSADAAR